MITENDMDEFIIYCTKEQIKKALELGASIERDGYEDRPYVYIDGAYLIPTAEQMIGWLESGRIDHIDIFKHANMWRFDIFCTWDRRLHCEPSHFYSRPEATLAAIDAVLEYLSSKNG